MLDRQRHKPNGATIREIHVMNQVVEPKTAVLVALGSLTH